MAAPQASIRKGYVGGEFLTGTYRISGEVALRGDPLMDQLNDHMALFIRLERMFISPLLDPATLTGNFPSGEVRKKNLALVVLHQMKDGLPHRSGKYTGRDNVDRHVLLVAAGVEVRGAIRLHPSVNVPNFIRTTPEDFIPIFNATATLTARPAIVFEGGAILLNRHQIEIFGMIEKPAGGR